MPATDNSGDTARFHDVVLEIRRRLSETPGKPSQSGPPQAVLYPPVTEQELVQEESRLGFHLPPLLRILYTEIGNGGFGPGGGLLPLRQMSPKIDQTVATLYHQLRRSRAKRGGKWQEGLVPYASWGDFIFSCIDLSATQSNDDPAVIRFEPNMPEVATHAYLKGDVFRGAGLIPERDRLSGWFMDWVTGNEMFHRPYKIHGEQKGS
jgi:hypothetical protein